MWRDIEELAAEDPPSPKELREVLENLARKAKARFYADENFPANAAAVLRSLGAHVVTAQEAGRGGHPDENHAAYALKNGLILVTCDRDFLSESKHPLIHCPAVFVFSFGSGSDDEIRRSYRCLASALRTPQFFDKWWKVEASPDSWTESVRYANGTTSRQRHRVWHGRVQQWVDE